MAIQSGMQRLGRWLGLGLSCTRAGGEFTGQGFCFGDRPTMYHRSPIYHLKSFASLWGSLAMFILLVSRASTPQKISMSFYTRTQPSADLQEPTSLSLTWTKEMESSRSCKAVTMMFEVVSHSVARDLATHGKLCG